MKKQIYLLVICCFSFFNIFAQYLDPSFGTDGVVYFPNEQYIRTIQGLPDGKVLVLGDTALYRLNVDGTTDVSFGNNGAVGIGCAARYMELMPDNAHIVMMTSCDENNVKVYDTSGNLVNEITIITECYWNLTPISSDRIRVMDCEENIHDQNIFDDTDFFTFPDGFPTSNEYYRAVTMSRGEDFTITMGAVPHQSWDPVTLEINKINDDSLTPEWTYSETFSGESGWLEYRLGIYGTLVQSDGKVIYNYGYSDDYECERHIRRLNLDGSVDSTFNNLKFYGAECGCDCLKPAGWRLTPDDEIIMAFNESGFANASALRRYDKDGNYKFSYQASVIGFGFHIGSIFVQPDNSVLVSIREYDAYAGDWTNLVARFATPGCLAEGIVFTTQAQIDNFAINYPDCTSISGDVTIEGNQITNLNGLAQINSIGGYLQIKNNDILLNYVGLNNLNRVGGELYLYNNAAVNLNGFESLSSVGNSTAEGIRVESNDHLINLEGLESITSLNVLKIQNNDALNSLLELENLTSVGDLIITDNPSLTTLVGLEGLTSMNLLELRSNDALTNLTGLENVTSIETVIVYTHDGLVNLDGLNNLNTVNLSLNIGHNAILNSLLELENLTSVGDLNINNNPSLTTLTGLEGVTSVERLTISFNDNLPNLTGLDNLALTEDDLKIHNNASLTSFAGLNNLSSIGRRLSINYNPSLSSLNGMNNLTQVGHIFYLGGNGSLVTLNGLENLSSIGYFAKIETNASLVSLDGLQNLNTIGGYLTIDGNDNLTSLTGLNGLISTSGGLNIFLNTVLNDITALENLTSISGPLRINGNDALLSLNALKNVDEIVSYLSITENPMLSFCSVTSICNYLADDLPHIIHSNDADCSTTEIPIICTLPIELIDFQAKIENKTALLTWETATETNNKGFEIQRSKDGIEWEKIGWQDGQGTSTTPHSYVYRDDNPFSGTSYYRLQQIDFDGTSSYSDVVKVNYVGGIISIQPNPVKNTLHIIDLNGSIIQNITIFDQMGKKVVIKNSNANTLDVSALSSGVYIIEITLDNSVFSERFIVKP